MPFFYPASMEVGMADEQSPQSKGGAARAAAIPASQRSQIARTAAAARWASLKELPKATHGSAEHPLRIGDIEIPCYVLEDGRRVLSLGGMVKALGMSIGGAGSGEGDRLAKFTAGKAISPFISSSLSSRITEPVRFRVPSGGTVATGYEATILPEICEAVLSARQAGELMKQQLHIAEQCEGLIRAFAKIGIVALVDEATGFQQERDRDELHRLLSVYLAEERLAWAKRFPDEFYKQIYRLKGWGWPVGKAKTPLLGHITNDIVYDRLPEGVIDKLRELNPTDDDTKRRRFKHHQFLSQEVGQPDLRDHIMQLIPIMKISRDWGTFKRHVDVAFPKIGT
jgi:hypothetical protein